MKTNYLLAALIVFVITGCAPHKSLYTWNDYSASLYKLKKEPSDEHLASHMQVLVKIMDDSKTSGQRVPPGLYCEYGYLLLKGGKSDEALKYFDLEAKTYPESTVFIERLKTKIPKAKE